MLKSVVAASAVLSAVACNAVHAQSSVFAVNFTWDGTAQCFDPKSPPFSLSGVPSGTKVLRFVMKDLDAPNYPHGGGAVPYTGRNQIPRGAFTYRGPCPPRGQHRYQWTVEAQDGAGHVLARAAVMREFPER